MLHTPSRHHTTMMLIRDRLADVPATTLFGMQIREGLKDNLWLIVRDIRQQYYDNPVLVTDIVGVRTMKLILSI